MPTHDPHIADIFRKANLERAQQDRRIANIFGTHTVSKVHVDGTLEGAMKAGLEAYPV